jgi:beta-lactamase class A
MREGTLRSRLGQWLRQHNQFVRRGFFACLGLVAIVIIVQLAYPSGRVLPFVTIEHIAVGGQSSGDARHKLDQTYKNARLTVKTQDASFVKTLDEVGVTIESAQTVKNAASYPVWQRFIPLSSIAIMAHRSTPTVVAIDNERLAYFAEQVSKDGYVPAVNASVKVDGTKVSLVPAQQSKVYAKQAIIDAVKHADFVSQTAVQLTPKRVDAERTNSEVKAVLQDAQKAVNTPLTLTVNGEKVNVDKTTIASWLDFTEDAHSKKLQLGVKKDVVTAYLMGIQKKMYKAPGVTTVQLVDGIEVSRTVGEPGRGIDVDKTIALLGDAINKGTSTTVTVPIASLAPKISYQRTYSKTDAGLAALLNDLGVNGIGISVAEVGGSARKANINGGKQFTSASTYKLFVAYAVFKEMDAGRMDWGTTINGKRADECFDAMIVKSDNPCAKAFGEKIGWQNIENQMRGLGLTSTELSPDLLTTANDLTLFLTKLQGGSLINSDQQNRLLSAMKRQIYRSGIPAGVGVTVADKVGFIDSYLHDAGIVYGAKGPYALTIMTSGSSWSKVADIARQINNYLSQ